MTIEVQPNYVHAKAVGERTPAFSGPSLSTDGIFDVISQRVADGQNLRRIAYVQSELDDPAMPYFAETVAVNRGVNVRMFQSLEAAQAWLSRGN